MSHTVLHRLFPHRLASELFDRSLDEERGDGVLDEEDRAFLDGHVERCRSCSAAFDARRSAVTALLALGAEKAPPGFAGRVLIAAKARPRVEDVRAVRPSFTFSPALAGALGAAAVALVLVVGLGVRPSSSALDASGVGALGSGPAKVGEESARAHLVVRAPGVGAAKVRSQVIAIVSAHAGTSSERGGVIVARFPRSALLAVTQDLASRGPFKMAKAEELPPEAGEVTIRFELE